MTGTGRVLTLAVLLALAFEPNVPAAAAVVEPKPFTVEAFATAQAGGEPILLSSMHPGAQPAAFSARPLSIFWKSWLTAPSCAG